MKTIRKVTDASLKGEEAQKSPTDAGSNNGSTGETQQY